MSVGSIISSSSAGAPVAHPADAVQAPSLEQPSHQFFHYKQGGGLEKSDFSKNKLLTLNMDMLKGPLPALYGGITAPIPLRAAKLGEYLKEKNPDIFLGQEIPFESALVVYESLKDQFPHFWMGMGLEPGKKESGLFVASKYPIESEPVFTPFGDAMQRVYNYPGRLHDTYPVRILDRGFFRVETKDYWAVTTHLEPGNPQEAGIYRRDQLAFVTQEMDRVSAKSGKPYIFVGDFNIRNTHQNGDEYTRSGIPDLFYDQFTERHPTFDESTYTCTNLIEAVANNYPAPEDPTERNEIDDYVLVRKHDRQKFKNFDVKLHADTYDVAQDPSLALTDHRAYEATWEAPK